MALRLRVKEVARQKGFSMGKLQRNADVAYNTVKRMYKDPYHVITTETLGKLAKALGVSPGSSSKKYPMRCTRHPSSAFVKGASSEGF